MRIIVFAILGACAGCTAIQATAPIQFKTSSVPTGPDIDGVELATLCELIKRVGKVYQAPDMDDVAIAEIEGRRLNFDLLEIGDASCGRPEDVIELPFVSDPQRTLVSTWGEFVDDTGAPVWGTCIADTSRKPGDRVVHCETSPLEGTDIAPPMPEPEPEITRLPPDPEPEPPLVILPEEESETFDDAELPASPEIVGEAASDTSPTESLPEPEIAPEITRLPPDPSPKPPLVLLPEESPDTPDEPALPTSPEIIGEEVPDAEFTEDLPEPPSPEDESS